MTSLLDPTTLIFVRAEDSIALRHLAAIIEEGQWIDLRQGWRARADTPHVRGMMGHVHLELRRNQVAVINRDGSPSHGSNIDQVPNRIIRSLRDRGLIESANDLFLEHASWGASLSAPIIDEAVKVVENRKRLERLLGGAR